MWDYEDPEDMIQSAFVLLCSSQALVVPEDEYDEAKKRWIDAYESIWLSKRKRRRDQLARIFKSRGYTFKNNFKGRIRQVRW